MNRKTSRPRPLKVDTTYGTLALYADPGSERFGEPVLIGASTGRYGQYVVQFLDGEQVCTSYMNLRPMPEPEPVTWTPNVVRMVFAAAWGLVALVALVTTPWGQLGHWSIDQDGPGLLIGVGAVAGAILYGAYIAASYVDNNPNIGAG